MDDSKHSIDFTKSALINAAEALAREIHKDQKYSNGLPYTDAHLKKAVGVGVDFIHYIPLEEVEPVVSAIWLHDSWEDQPDKVNFRKIREAVGNHVAQLVYAVTNELGVDRIDTALKTYPKIRNDQYAVFIKLCDRIANVKFGIDGLTSASIAEECKSRLAMYKKEYPMFRYCLKQGNSYPDMWKLLDDLHEQIGAKK